ncbi:DoxX family protein [Arthrobacter sp. 3Tela_A]|uniref:DoxX family protein n=1 Tax=Arthrobacter sp. 3Tela_A TaxID=3093743 RepID=UPI003BB6BC54
MDEGLLLLRLLIGAVLLAHAAQKSLGWFQGQGLGVMSGVFESLGLRPGRVMVRMASATEALAGLSLLLGLFLPLGAAAAAGTMTVAGAVSQLKAGSFWNARGGGEYPYVLAVTATGLAFTGAGAFSADALLAERFPGLAPLLGGTTAGTAAVLLAAAAALVFLTLVRRRTAKSPTA